MEKTYKNLIRVKAIDGNNLKPTHFMNQYEVACVQSHIKAIRQAFKDGAKEALIMEDDVYIDNKHMWGKSIQQIISNRPKDAECIILHCSNPKACKKMLMMGKDYSKWAYRTKRKSTGCYYITREGMKKIFANFPVNFVPKGKAPADTFIYTVLNSYNYTKPLFNIKRNQSLVVKRMRFDKEKELVMDRMFRYYYKKRLRIRIEHLKKYIRKINGQIVKTKNKIKKEELLKTKIHMIKTIQNLRKELKK
jgi:GR25 family glycosyltransferase involved in LPS biosynthesis